MKLVEIKDWSDERLITRNTPDRNGFNAMITEELMERLEANSSEDIIDALADINVFCIGEIYKYDKNAAAVLGSGHISDWFDVSRPGISIDLKECNEESYTAECTFLLGKFLEADKEAGKVRAIADIVKLTMFEINSMGYDCDKVMDQVMIEIGSRTGAYSEATKKWQKDKSTAAKAKWKSADYTICLKD